MYRTLSLLIVGSLACAACSQAPAPPRDLILKRKVTAVGAAATESTCYWGARQRVTDDPVRRILFDLDAKTVTVLDKTHNVYFVLPFEQILKQRKAQNDRFEALPEEERKKVGLDKAIELTPTGKTETIAGHASKEFTFGGSQLSGSVWIAEDMDPPPGWAEWSGVIANVESSGYAGRQVAEQIARHKGYPMRSSLNVTMGARQTAFTAEVTEASFDKIPADIIALPPGATKADPPAALK